MRVGIIGCGEIAQTHARFILEDKQRTVVGVCDIDGEKARAFAERFRVAKSYEDVELLLEEQRPEGVHVLTPPQSHAAIAIAAMTAGCSVLLEKPMAMCVEEADAMLAVARRTGVQLCVNHNQLFEPVMSQAYAVLQQGGIGDIISVESHYGLNFVPDPARPWVEALPDGVFQNLAPHPLYLILEFLGDPVEMHVATLNTGLPYPDIPDELRILIKGERAIGYVAVSLGIRPNVNFLRISGTRATLHVDFASKIFRLERLKPLPKSVARGTMNLDIAGQLTLGTLTNAFKLAAGRLKPYQGHRNLIEAFYRSIETDGAPPVSMESARRVVEVYDRIRAELFTTQ